MVEKEEVKKKIEEKEVENGKPLILTFLCNWCSYEGADQAGGAKKEVPPNILPIKVMCSGRIDPTFVLHALENGADGVLILGCHPGDCHYKEGNYNMLGRMEIFEKYMEQMGIHKDRVMLDWVSASEGTKFSKVTKEMTEQVEKLGEYKR